MGQVIYGTLAINAHACIYDIGVDSFVSVTIHVIVRIVYGKYKHTVII